MSMAADDQSSYIDYDVFLDSSFASNAFANSLVLSTNNSSDTSLDLSTPLSKVLFDLQEIDSHIHTLTTQNALPLLQHVQAQDQAGQEILSHVETQVRSLTTGYDRLDKEVLQRHNVASEVTQTVERLWQTVRSGRAVSRCLLLARQLEAQMLGMSPISSSKKDDHKAMIRAANTLLSLRQLLAANKPGEEGEHLLQIKLISGLQSSFISPTESTLQSRAQQVIREFAMSSLASGPTAPTTYAQSEETKARTTSALLALHLLSPQSQLVALQGYLRTALTSSLASVTRALTSLPSLERTLLEVSARCQNIVALESLLETVKPLARSQDYVEPPADTDPNLLEPLLASLDTSSLPSYFWRSLAEGLAGRVSDLVARGGTIARSLKNQREQIRGSIRDCVIRGSQGPAGGRGREGAWEREAAVMVGSVVGALGR